MTVMTRIVKAKGGTGPLLGLSGEATLRTPCGGRRIENVRPGDLIVTRDNGLQAVKMVWTREVTAAEIAGDPSVAPVRLKPRAIGPMMPQRDLLLAASHRILVPGYRLVDMPDETSCLIPARDIQEASDAAYLDREPVDRLFFNLVFDSHQVFCANGLPVESYLPSRTGLSELDEAVRGDLRTPFQVEGKNPGFPVPRYSAPEPKNYRPEFV